MMRAKTKIATRQKLNPTVKAIVIAPLITAEETLWIISWTSLITEIRQFLSLINQRYRQLPTRMTNLRNQTNIQLSKSKVNLLFLFQKTAKILNLKEMYQVIKYHKEMLLLKRMTRLLKSRRKKKGKRNRKGPRNKNLRSKPNPRRQLNPVFQSLRKIWKNY